jgi:hypothetical protein
MRKLLLGVLLVAVATAGVAILGLRPGRAPRVATGTVGHTLCSEVFVAGLDPGPAFREIFG